MSTKVLSMMSLTPFSLTFWASRLRLEGVVNSSAEYRSTRLSCNVCTFTDWMITVLMEDEMTGSDQVMVLGEMGP